MGVEFTAVDFVAAVVVLVPGPWFWRTRNIAMLFLVVWLFAINTIAGVNSVIWAGNTRPVHVVWCDIVTKIIIGANSGLPACCLSASFHLERLSSFRRAHPVVYRTRARTIFDIFMCWGLPAACAALHYVVQGHRFAIYEDMGCYPTWYWSVPGIIVVTFIPFLMVAVSLVFTVLAFTHFTRHRALTIKYLPQGTPALTKARFYRLLAVVFIQVLCSLLIVISLLVLVSRGQGQLKEPWASWRRMHTGLIKEFPKFSTHDPYFVWQYIVRLLPPIAAFSLFAFFSFNTEVLKDYLAAFCWFRRVVFRCPQNKSNAADSDSHPKAIPRNSDESLEKTPPDLSLPAAAYASRNRRARYTSIQFAKVSRISSRGASDEGPPENRGHFQTPSVYTININVDVVETPPQTANRSRDVTFLSPHWLPQTQTPNRRCSASPYGGIRPPSMTSESPYGGVHPSSGTSERAPIQYPQELRQYLATRSVWSSDSQTASSEHDESGSLERNASIRSVETLDVIVDSSVAVPRGVREMWDRKYARDETVAQRWTTPSPGFDFSPALRLSPWNKSFLTLSRASVNAIAGESPQPGESDDGSGWLRPVSVYTLDVELPPSLRRV